MCLRFGALLFRRADQSALKSTCRFFRRQRLPHIRLRNTELSCNSRRSDASFERCADGIHLTTGQRDIDYAHLSSAWCLIGRRSSFRHKSDGRRDDGVDSAPILHRSLRRRLASSSATAQSSSNSSSLKCLTVLLRFFGRICRCGGVSLMGLWQRWALVADGKASRPASGEKRSALLARQDRVP